MPGMTAPPLLLVLLLALAALGAQAAPKVTSNNKKVQVQVMYESLCPDSIRFIRDQLAPAYEALGSQRMLVEFVPYGKAATYPTDSGYLFRCQHGSAECRGNKIMACGLARLLSDNKKQVKFVNCVMSQTNPSRLNDKCVSEAGLESSEITDCVNGREGQVLLAGMGERTPSNIDFVPRVVFNGEFKQVDQDQALSNLIYVVCDKLAPSERLPACERKKESKLVLLGLNYLSTDGQDD